MKQKSDMKGKMALNKNQICRENGIKQKPYEGKISKNVKGRGKRHETKANQWLSPKDVDCVQTFVMTCYHVI